MPTPRFVMKWAVTDLHAPAPFPCCILIHPILEEATKSSSQVRQEQTTTNSSCLVRFYNFLYLICSVQNLFKYQLTSVWFLSQKGLVSLQSKFNWYFNWITVVPCHCVIKGKIIFYHYNRAYYYNKANIYCFVVVETLKALVYRDLSILP